MIKQFKVQSGENGKGVRWLCSKTNRIYMDSHDAAAFDTWKQAQQAALAHRAETGRIVKIHEEIGAALPKAQTDQLRVCLANCWANLQNTYASSTGRLLTCQKDAVEDVLNSLTLLGGVSREIEALLPRLSKDALRKLAREVVNPMALNDEPGEGGEIPNRYAITHSYEEVKQWNADQARKRALKAKNAAVVDAREEARA